MSQLWTYLYQGPGDHAIMHLASFDNEAQAYKYAALHLNDMWRDEAAAYKDQMCGGVEIDLESPESVGTFWNHWGGIGEFGFNWLLIESKLNPPPFEGETII